MILAVLSKEKRPVAVPNAGGDQAVGRQMSVSSGEPPTLVPLLGADPNPDDAPAIDPVYGIRDRTGGEGKMKNEGLDGGDPHVRFPFPRTRR
jgi:hypothetical protein